MNETIRPDSSMIQAYAWDPESQELEVVFVKGGTYSYSGVPEHVFEAMKQAPSVGRFFLAEIKGQY